MLSPRHALMLVAAAAVIAWTLGRFRERESLTRHSVALALGVVFCAGFFLLHKWAEAIPSSHRHWLLYVGIGASVLGTIGAAPGVTTWERILVAIDALDRFAPLFIEDVEPEIESSQQLDEPLVNQSFRYKDENALRAAGEDQPMKDQACFNRLAEAHFMRKQDAG